MPLERTENYYESRLVPGYSVAATMRPLHITARIL